jgi:nicotinamidase-related amidase
MRGTIPWQPATSRWPFTLETMEIDLEHTALLAIDLQVICVNPKIKLDPGVRETRTHAINEVLLPNVQRLLAWFRGRGMPVLHTRVGYALPEGRDMHRWRRMVNMWCRYGEPPFALLDEVAALPGEIVLDKNSSGAFVGSPLDFYLHNLDIQTLVVCGVATQACVQHTVRDAADLGYNVILVEDACYGSSTKVADSVRTFEVFGRVFGAVKSTSVALDELTAIERGEQLSTLPAQTDRMLAGSVG